MNDYKRVEKWSNKIGFAIGSFLGMFLVYGSIAFILILPFMQAYFHYQTGDYKWSGIWVLYGIVNPLAKFVMIYIDYLKEKLKWNVNAVIYAGKYLIYRFLIGATARVSIATVGYVTSIITKAVQGNVPVITVIYLNNVK